MKNLLFTLSLFFAVAASAQYQVPPYKQNKAVPGFELEQAGNKKFNTTSLKKGVPVMIMFFSPGCDHCIHQFEDMVKRMKDLKNYQIVMATYQPIEELEEFNAKYKISKYPNIITGRDANYFLPAESSLLTSHSASSTAWPWPPADAASRRYLPLMTRVGVLSIW